MECTKPLARTPLRVLAAGLIVAATLVGCGVGSGPGPQARSAADKLEDAIVAMRRDAGGVVAGTPDTQLFARAFDYVRVAYVRSTESQHLLEAAVAGLRDGVENPAKAEDSAFVEAATQAMLHSLDDYSTYLDRDGYRRLKEETQGRFGGLGIEIKKAPEGLEVISPIEGTPAARAGIRPGDRIVAADGQPLAAMTLREAVEMLRGVVGTTVTLTIRRGDQPPRELTIERAIVRIEPVTARLEGDVGYLRVAHFSDGTGRQLRAAMDRLEAESGGALRGYVVDLRNNPGGLLDEAVAVASAFLSGGQVVVVEGREEREAFEADAADPSAGRPVVVLVNEGSASASEIVAGALKDHDRAVVLGERSFGKGSVQTILPLPGARGIKLTTALYFTPDGHTVEGGIAPDIVAERDGDAAHIGATGDVAQDGPLREALTLVVRMAGGHSVYWSAGTVQR